MNPNIGPKHHLNVDTYTSTMEPMEMIPSLDFPLGFPESKKYSRVMTNIAMILKMAIEIVSFPVKNEEIP